MSAMTNIVEQLFKSLDPWPGFQITSFKIQVSPVDGRKTLILDLRPVEGSMPICSRCRHEAPLVHSYVSRRIKECSLLGYFVELNVTFRRVDCLHCKGHPMEAVEWLAPFKRYTELLRAWRNGGLRCSRNESFQGYSERDRQGPVAAIVRTFPLG